MLGNRAFVLSSRRNRVRSVFAVGSTVLFAILVLAVVLILVRRRARRDVGAASASNTPALHLPVRAEPTRFPPNEHLPPRREGAVCLSVDPNSFSPGRDLVRVDDARVWWESDQDENDDEDDHSMHYAMETPLRRLIELVAQRGGTLKVQDAYRASRVHSSRSLHKEGRALDLTCDEWPLEDLAKLCWAAGFDWVYYEAPKGGGEHIHCSIIRPPAAAPDAAK